jgi:hypothetical protein
MTILLCPTLWMPLPIQRSVMNAQVIKQTVTRVLLSHEVVKGHMWLLWVNSSLDFFFFK